MGGLVVDIYWLMIMRPRLQTTTRLQKTHGKAQFALNLTLYTFVIPNGFVSICPINLAM